MKRNYAYDEATDNRIVISKWVEDGDNLTLYGSHQNMIISIKYDEIGEEWDMGAIQMCDASTAGPFDAIGLPVGIGPHSYEEKYAPMAVPDLTIDDAYRINRIDEIIAEALGNNYFSAQYFNRG